MQRIMNIQKLRLAAGLCVSQLAAQMGVSAANVVAWECETYLPKARHLPLLAKVLGCTIDELFKQEVSHED